MMYYYKIRVEYKKGGSIIFKDYKISFLDIGKFFIWLEKKHKDNYKLIFIKDVTRYGGKIPFYEAPY